MSSTTTSSRVRTSCSDIESFFFDIHYLLHIHFCELVLCFRGCRTQVRRRDAELLLVPSQFRCDVNLPLIGLGLAQLHLLAVHGSKKLFILIVISLGI